MIRKLKTCGPWKHLQRFLGKKLAEEVSPGWSTWEPATFRSLLHCDNDNENDNVRKLSFEIYAGRFEELTMADPSPHIPESWVEPILKMVKRIKFYSRMAAIKHFKRWKPSLESAEEAFPNTLSSLIALSKWNIFLSSLQKKLPKHYLRSGIQKLHNIH